MKLKTCLVAVLASAANLALADAVADWNEMAVAAGYAARQGPPPHTRIVAMVHLAMFEAMNSVDRRYRPYRARLAAEPGASREAAAASAAHYLLVRIYPDQTKEMDKALQASLATVTDETAKTKGIRVGERAGAAMLAERANDGAAGPDTYRPFTAPGKYVPTVLPAAPRWGAVRPFALKSGDQFRPPAPYALSSAEWAKDCRIPPHRHPGLERVTVLTGTVNIGMAEKFDAGATTAMGPGTVLLMSAGMPHFVWTSEETIFQLNVEGPWGVTYVNPADDPRKKPPH